ncbi:MAG TPA: multicopper oxidase domain-containing protein [Lacipirellula sp.]
MHQGRTFVSLAAVGLAVLLHVAPLAAAQPLLDVTTLEKYVDLLPNPLDNVISPSGSLDGSPLYEISVGQFQQKVHRDLAPTTLWGYNGSYPGPTFDVPAGQQIKVEWTNNLVDGQGQPLDHFLPYDVTLHGAGHGMPGFPEARTVPHLHGGITPANSDGYPEHWFTPDPNAPANGLGGPAGNQMVTTYPNVQRSANLWYHDHAMAITRLNVYAGMAGFYLLRDPEEASLNLPSGDFEVPLLLQDRSFYEDGQLYYPAGPGEHAGHGGDPLEGLPDHFHGDASVVKHFHGDANLVNGVVWPLMEVEPRKYRFRMLNGANARFYDLQLEDAGQNAVPMFRIGSDVGLNDSVVEQQRVLLGPADRADLIVDFSNFNVGDELLLKNLGPDGPFGLQGGGPADPSTTGQVMKFRIKPLGGPDTSSLPATLPAIERLDPADSVITRVLTLSNTIDEFGREKLLLNGKSWEDAVTEVVKLGDTEIWEFRNATADAHPMHLHLGHFQILERFDRQTKQVVPIPEEDSGWEDTFIVNPRENVKILARFDQFAGRYVWHCHILEHEDHEMMRPFDVIVPEPSAFVMLSVAAITLYSRAILARRPV